MPPIFKFKYFYTSYNPSNGIFLANSNVASNNRGEIQSKRELATSKGKQVVIDVLVIYSCSNFLANSPSLGIDSVEGPQVLVEVLE
jgi:hypothetical protein